MALHNEWFRTSACSELENGYYLKSMKLEDYITIMPEVRSGKPCIKDTRITVADVLEYLAGGMTEAEILSDFPALSADHIRACLGFAAARERRLAIRSAV